MEQISSGRNKKLENMSWVIEGNHQAMPERQTEFSSPELIYNSANVNIKTAVYKMNGYGLARQSTNKPKT